ncbi:MAG: transposase, partial [Pyrinomonadaceae bacterium]|nr:transposase [Pyrinomonadaceae bacterium]
LAQDHFQFALKLVVDRRVPYMGITTFAVLSDGNKIENQRFFRQSEKRLVVAQRQLSKQEKSSQERPKKRKIVAKIHASIKNRRSDFAHQESRKLVNSYDLIVFEKLNISGMVKNHCLAKSICDASWNQLIEYTSYKAESAGRKTIQVNPNYTSQDCSNCGARQKLTLDIRLYDCPNCHIKIDRDLNAAKNILTAGLRSLGIQSLEAASKPCLVVE